MTEVHVSAAPRRPLQLKHLGAAGWEIRADGQTVLIDPYVSRLRYRGKSFGVLSSPEYPGDTRPVYGPDDPLQPDLEAIDRHVSEADYILVSHTHFNHSIDAPEIAKRTGALLLGSESTINLARAAGVPDTQLIPVTGGQDLDFGALSVKVIPSLHSAANDKRYLDTRVLPPDVQLPLTLNAYVEGGTLAYYLRLGGHEIIVFSSMNYIERELQGLSPDIALVPAARPRLQVFDFTGRLLRTLEHPSVVIATHWDVQSLPYGASQDAAWEQARDFVREAREASPAAQVLLPNHFDVIAIDEGCRARLLSANSVPAG